MVAEVVGDVSKLGPQMQRDVQRALARVDVNLDPQFREIAADADKVFSEVARDADASFDLVERDADEAADRIGTEFEQGGERAERAFDEAQDRARREFNQIGNHANTAGGNIGKVMTRAALAIGAAFAAVQVGQFFISATTLAEDLGSAMANTAQIIKSTKGAAGLLAGEVRELSRVLGLKIGVDSVEVQNAANILLTFKEVSKDTFGTALALAADMSAVLGSDLKGAALQVGKALNDPIKGISALARAGVQFTTQQKDQIKALVASNDLLGAQEVILGEIESQVGGVALAGADVTDKLTAAFTDLKREAGEALIGFLDDNGPRLIALIQTMGPIVGKIGGIIADALTAVLPFVEIFANAFQDKFAQIAPALAPLADVFEALLSIIPAIIPSLVEIAQGLFPPLAAAAVALAAALVPIVKLAAQLGAQIVAALLPILPPLADALQQIATVVGAALLRLLPPLADAVVQLVTALLPLVPTALDLVLAMLPLVDPLVDILIAVLPLVDALLPLVDILVQIANVSIKVLAPLIELAATFAAFLVADEMVPNINLLVGALAALLAPLEKLTPFFDEFSSRLENLNWGTVGEQIATVFSRAWTAVSEFFLGISRWFRELPGRIGGFLAALPGVIVGGLSAALNAGLEAIGVGIGLWLAWLIGFPRLALAAIAKLPPMVWELVSNLWRGARERSIAGGSSLLEFFRAIPGRVWSALSRLPGLMRDAINGAFRAARDAAAGGISRLVGLVSSLPDRIRGLRGRMVSAGAALISGFLSGLKRIGGFASDVGAGIVRAVRSSLNSVIGSINRGIASIDAKLPFGLPRIPSLATGGLTTRGGLAQLHAGEMVLPLQDRRAVDLLAQAMSEASAGLRAAGVPTTGEGAAPAFDVRVYIGDRELTDLVDVHISRRDRQLVRRVTAGGGRRSNR
jgi:phage-related protein